MTFTAPISGGYIFTSTPEQYNERLRKYWLDRLAADVHLVIEQTRQAIADKVLWGLVDDGTLRYDDETGRFRLKE